MTAAIRRRMAVGVSSAALLFAACGDRQAVEHAAAITGGDPGRGRVLAGDMGCGACHVIPGVPGARALVGPPLAGIASRVYIAGVLPNTPQNMVQWLMNPPAINERTVMPDLRLNETDATHLAAFLYTLK